MGGLRYHHPNHHVAHDMIWLDIQDNTHLLAFENQLTELLMPLELKTAEQKKIHVALEHLRQNVLSHHLTGRLIATMSNTLEHGPVVNLLFLDRDPGIPGHGFRPFEDLQGFDLIQRHTSRKDRRVHLLRLAIHSKQRAGTTGRSGSLVLPVKSAEPCGDAWTSADLGKQCKVVLIDGLGHGPEAAKAAEKAVSLFQQLKFFAPGEILEQMHYKMFDTRGAAVAIAQIDPENRRLKYSGLGNISARILSPERTTFLTSKIGTVGMEAGQISEFDYPIPLQATLVMHTDGIRQSWYAEDYLPLLTRDPLLFAGVLYHDQQVDRDDSGVVIHRMGT